jgi:hypothetical protein
MRQVVREIVSEPVVIVEDFVLQLALGDLEIV